MYPHYGYFIKIASRLTRDEDAAKDLVQETYIRAYRYFNTYEKNTNPKAWLYRILKNLFIDSSVKKKKEPVLLSDYETPDTNLWYSISESEKQMSDEYLMAINSIKDEYRMVIILFHLESYSIVEIAEFLKLPVGTVKSRLFRARRILKDTIAGYTGESKVQNTGTNV
jgi:RNA polymerase sigma factor (sigma-70 family)